MVVKKVLLMLSLLSMSAFSLYISVDISGNIKADTNYMKYPTTVSSKPIKLVFNLENIGSITCDAYYKVEFKSGDKILYSAWSRKSVLKPGDIELFNIYWNPTTKGHILVSPKLYMCGDMYKLQEFYINVTDVINKTTDKVNVKYKNTKKNLKLVLSSNETRKVFIIPQEYPQGWRFEPREIELKKGENEVEIQFYTPFFTESELKLNIVSEDGEINDMETIKLRTPKWYEEIDLYRVGFYVFLIASILEMILILKISNLKKIRKKVRI